MMQMGSMGKKKNKPVQYVVGGSVAVVILGFWISMPLMSGGSGFSSFSSGNPFNSKVANIATLGTSDSSQAGRDGAVLSGEMIANPATSGEDILSSLFQSGPSEDPVEVTADGAANADASAEAPSAGAGGGDIPAPAQSRPMGKLAATPSLGGSGGGTMTGSSNHNKFFGSAGAQKAEFTASLGGPDVKKMVAEPGKKGEKLSSLNSAMENSKNALKTPDLSATRGSAAAAFTGSKGGAMDSLNKTAEKSEENSIGLDDGASTTANLKRNDPNISKRKVAPPAVNAAKEVKDPNEEWKQMLTKMLIQAAFGMVFGGFGGGGGAGGGGAGGGA